MERAKPLVLLFPPVEVPPVSSSEALSELCRFCLDSLLPGADSSKSELETFINAEEKDELSTLEKVVLLTSFSG